MYLFALTEMCQRFAFWGTGNLLVLYLVQKEAFTDAVAEQIFGIFTGVAFILPILGGYIADRLNYRLPVIWGMLFTALGSFLIATGVITLVYVGLALIAVGGAIFTPGIYALLGTLYRQQHHLRDSGFTIYYASVNIGVFLAMIVLGALGQAKSWNLAFLVAGLVQLVGMVPFYQSMKSLNAGKLTQQRVAPKATAQPPLNRQEKSRIFVICILSFFSILFWMAYNQGGSSMNLFALRYTDLNAFGFKMPPSWLLSSESLYLVILAIPLAKLYHYLSQRKKDPTPPAKSVMSFFSMAICFLIMTIGASQIPPLATGAAISPFYLFSAYLFMAIGEMLICPIGLSLITHLSPHRFTAFLVGVWYVCIGAGFYLGGLIAPLMSKLTNLNAFFGIFVVISAICGIILLLFVKKLNKMRHLESL